MATNIEMNYFDGSSYIALRPMGNLNNMEGSLNASQIPDLDASKITSGSFGTDRIPNLDMAKITTGNLAGSRISGYVSDASYAINSGKVGGYTYSQIISNASSGGGMNVSKGYITQTTSDRTTVINWSGFVGKVAILYCDYADTQGNYQVGGLKMLIGAQGIKAIMLQTNARNNNYFSSYEADCTWSSYKLTYSSGFVTDATTSHNVYYIIMG